MLHARQAPRARNTSPRYDEQCDFFARVHGLMGFGRSERGQDGDGDGRHVTGGVRRARDVTFLTSRCTSNERVGRQDARAARRPPPAAPVRLACSADPYRCGGTSRESARRLTTRAAASGSRKYRLGVLGPGGYNTCHLCSRTITRVFDDCPFF